MRPTLFKFILIFLFVQFSASSFANHHKKHNYEKQIKQVLNQFVEALEEKKEDTFFDLILSPNINWKEVSPDQRKGELPSEIGINNPLLFYIPEVFTRGKKMTLDLNDLNILSDGEVAVAHFKHKMVLEGKIDREGEMSIHLIQTPQGWKVSSVVESNGTRKVPHKARERAKQEILNAMDDYNDAELKKDEARFFKYLFDTSLISYAIVPAERKGKSFSQSGVQPWNHADGWKWGRLLEDKPANSKEWDVQIDTDGEIASVFAKYNYRVDGKVANWGSVSRQYIRVNGVWKIVSHIFSATNNSNDPRDNS